MDDEACVVDELPGLVLETGWPGYDSASAACSHVERDLLAV